MKTAELSELRNAERLLESYASELRYTGGLGWLRWNGERWEQDVPGVVEASKDVLRTLYAEASAMKKKPKGLLSFLEESQSRKGIGTMMSLASTDGRVRIRDELLDVQPHLLNCRNGTIDLRSGALLPWNPGDLLTKQSPVMYDPNADQSHWRGLLASVTEGDEDMMRELQMLAGYSLLGGPNEQEIFIFMIGLPGSGKGTVVESIRRMMGTYASVTAFDTFLKRSQPQELRPDLARLCGLRMISASEVDKDQRVDEGILSMMTGRDTITARSLRREAISFLPQLTPWFMMNDPPRVNPDPNGTGFWRRAHVLDFRRAFGSQANPEVKTYCTDPARGGPAILRWAVEGTMAYLAAPGPIARCSRSLARAEAYREDNDPFAGFAAARLVRATMAGDTSVWVRKRDLSVAYKKYCEEESVRFPLDSKKIKKILLSPSYGCSEGYRHDSEAQVWYGIRERSESDDIQPANDLAVGG